VKIEDNIYILQDESVGYGHCWRW